MNTIREIFRNFAGMVSQLAGTAGVFLVALAVVLAWAVTGPIFHFSDTWQLVINTGTTIVTFLMVFLIQNTQNRDNTALHTKLDELIVVTKGARNHLVTAEDLSEEELRHLKQGFEREAKTADRRRPQRRGQDDRSSKGQAGASQKPKANARR